MKSRRPDLILIFVTIIWGSSFIAQRVGAAHVEPLIFNACRYGLAGLVIFLLSRFIRLPAREPSAYRLPRYFGYLLGLLLFFGSACQQTGLETTTAGKAGFLTTTYVVLVPFLALCTGHRLLAVEVIGAFLTLIGTYFISVNEEFSIASGDVWELFGAFWWGFHVLAVSCADRSENPLRLVWQQFFTCGVLSVCASWMLEPQDLSAIVRVAPMIVYSGIFSIALGYTMQLLVQHRVTPARAAIIYSMEAFFAASFGWLILSEQFSMRMGFGALLVLVGVVLAQAAPKEPAIKTLAVEL